MSYDIDLAPINWNTIVSLSLLGVVTVGIIAWATFELNGGGYVDPRTSTAGEAESRHASFENSPSEHRRLSLIWKSKPALQTTNSRLAEEHYEMTAMYSSFAPSDDGTGGLLSTHEGPSRIQGKDFISRLAPGLPHPARPGFLPQDKKEINVTAREVAEETENDRQRDRRILQGLKGMSNS